MQDRLIFDLGMHMGEDSEFYLKKGFSVVGVEANPALATIAAERLEQFVKSGRLKIITKAIARNAGPITFYASDTSIWGTTEKRHAERSVWRGAAVREITVDGINFADLLNEYGVPYYLKIDIEGADPLCLEALLRQPGRPKFISLESSTTSFDEVKIEFSLFDQLGYRKFKIIPQHRVVGQSLPNPAREGTYLEHRFQPGCSGAFGLELPGEWLSSRQAIEQYRTIHRSYRLTGEAAGPSGKRKVIPRLIEKGRTAPKSLSGFLVRNVVKPIFKQFSIVQDAWYDTHAMFTG
jgi:FkbM family methyltransferase